METLSVSETEEILKGVLGELVGTLKEKKQALEDYFDRISAIQRASEHETRCWVGKMSDERLLKDWDALEEEDEPLPDEPAEFKRNTGYKKFKKDRQSISQEDQASNAVVSPQTGGSAGDTATCPPSLSASIGVNSKRVDLLETDNHIRCPIADSIIKKYENIRLPTERYR